MKRRIQKILIISNHRMVNKISFHKLFMVFPSVFPHLIVLFHKTGLVKIKHPPILR